MKTALPRLIAIILLAVAGHASAADVGRVLLAAGDTVVVRDKQIIKLVFGSAIQDKDLLRTGPASNLQVRFIDESILSMRESSEIRIDEFRFAGKEDGTERAFFSLLKGGLRKVTGLIGRTNHKNYQMGSIVATIGIRGTDYATTLCQNDCFKPDGARDRNGQYARTIGASFGTNKLDFSTQVDQQIVGISQNVFAADRTSRIEFLLEAPGFLNVSVKGKSTKPPAGTGNEQAAAGGAQQDPRGTTPPAPPAVLPRLLTGASSTTDSVLDPITSATGPAPATAPSVTPTLGGVGAGVDGFGQASDGGAYLTPSMLTFNGSGILTGLNIPAGTTEVDGSLIDPPGVTGAASSVAESGSADPGDGSINARWVRWSTGTFTDDSGTSMLPGGFHAMVGNLAPPDVVAAKTGTFSFSTVGGTTPTNNLGQTPVSVFGYPSLIINFTSRVASLGSFFWSFPANSWSFPSGSANVIITPGKGAGIDGLYTGGSCSGTGCSGPITLGVTGIFYGPRGDHLGAAFAGQSGSASAMGVKLYTCAPSC